MATQTSTLTLLAKVKTQDILQLTLVQSVLEANFKAIIEALVDHEGKIRETTQLSVQNKAKTAEVESKTNTNAMEIAELRQLIEQMNNEKSQRIDKIQQALDALSLNPVKRSKENTSFSSSGDQEWQKIQKLGQQNAKNILENSSKLEKEFESIKREISIIRSREQKQHEKFEAKLREINNVNNDQDKQIGQSNQQLKSLQQTINNIDNKSVADSLNKFLEQKISELEANFNKQVNDILNRNTEEHSTIEGKISRVEKTVSDAKVVIEEQKRLRNKMNQEIWKLHESMTKMSQNKLSEEVNQDQIRQLRRDVVQLNKKLLDLANITHTKGSVNDTTFDSPTKLRSLQKQSPTKGDNIDGNDMLEKMKNLRLEVLKSLKKLDAKNESESYADRKKIEQLQEAINRINHILADKANVESVTKLVKSVENKVQFITNLLMGDHSQQDAAIARKNWFCLSCEKNLDKYQGKVGSHTVLNQLKVKGLEQEVIGGGMTLRPSKSKMQLPFVGSKSAKKT